MLNLLQDFVSETLAQTVEAAIASWPTRQYRLKNGAQVSHCALGVLCFEPASTLQQPSGAAFEPVTEIVLSAGIHGNETAPIELLNELIRLIADDQFQLRCRLLVILGNPWAIQAKQRQISHDLNRLFGQIKPTNAAPLSLEQQRAQQLAQITKAFFTGKNGLRYHLDLHCTILPSKRQTFAIYPYRANQTWSWPLLQLLASAGVNTALFQHAPSQTFSFYSSESCQAHSATVELGQAKPFGENDLTRLAALKTQLIRLLQQQPLALGRIQQEDLQLYQVAQTINKISEHFQFHVASDLVNFTKFRQGTLLASDGKLKHYVHAPTETIVFANAQVAIKQRALLTLAPAHMHLDAKQRWIMTSSAKRLTDQQGHTVG